MWNSDEDKAVANLEDALDVAMIDALEFDDEDIMDSNDLMYLGYNEED